jgi:hypothetical protein
MDQQRTISFSNGFSLQLAFDGDRFLGIGAVMWNGRLLRDTRLPWTLYTESDTGIRFQDFVLDEVQECGDGVSIVFTSAGRWMPRIQDADAMGDSRVKARRISNPSAAFRLSFRPISERIWENEWTGLAMQAEVSCPGNPVNWLIETATWEIGGQAAGCTLIQQDISTIGLEQAVEAGSTFSTIERFFTEKAGAWGGSFPMDMLPRCAGSSPLDFQTKGDLALCLFSEKPSLTRARLEKFADENVIHYLDRPFFPLTETAKPPERKLLVYQHPQPLQRYEWRNLWLDCFTEVRRRILDNHEFKPEVPRPTVHAHLWDGELKKRGKEWHKDLIAAFPEFAKLGFKGVFTHGVWESVTSDPQRRPEEGNICCPYAFRFAEQFGGAEGMKKLIDAAHAQGLKVFQWFGFQFARFSPLWKEHPEWVLREQNGDPWDGAYQILWCGRMRTGFRDLILHEIKKVKDDTGLDGIFFDSYQNLGVTCVDWQAPDKAPQAEEIWKLQSELQRYGFTFCCEVITIFGVSQVGTFGFEEDKFRRRLWADTVRRDEAFALLDCSPGFFCQGDAFTNDRISPELYFWLAGHRAVPGMGADPWHGNPRPGGDLADEYARVNRLYDLALPHMRRLRVTPRGDYTVWLDEGNRPRVAWCFKDAQMQYAGSVKDPENGGCWDTDGTLKLEKGKVYLLGQ